MAKCNQLTPLPFKWLKFIAYQAQNRTTRRSGFNKFQSCREAAAHAHTFKHKTLRTYTVARKCKIVALMLDNNGNNNTATDNVLLELEAKERCTTTQIKYTRFYVRPSTFYRL